MADIKPPAYVEKETDLPGQFFRAYGYPYLRIEVDGRPCYLGITQKAYYWLKFGLVYLEGEGFEQTHSAWLPADDDNGDYGTRGRLLKGYTDDPKIQEIYRQFLAYLKEQEAE